MREALLNKLLFCLCSVESVNIPFVVCGFGNNMDGRSIDFPTGTLKFSTSPTFENNEGKHFYVLRFPARVYKLENGSAEFNRCLRNLIIEEYL